MAATREGRSIPAADTPALGLAGRRHEESGAEPDMDRRAAKILLDTFWGSWGWKPDDAGRAAPEDLACAKSKGVMFDPA